MRRLISALAAFVLAFAAPAQADPSPIAPTQRPARTPAGDPSVAELQQMLGDVGAWSLEYSAVMTAAAAVMDEVESYTVIMDRVANRQIRNREALAQLETWRVNAIARAQGARERAIALRGPPALSTVNEEMAALEAALVLARDELPTLVDEMVVSLEAWAAYGVEAIQNPRQAPTARLRAVYASSIQLLRIDTRRISASARALPLDHPNRALMEAMVAYELGLSAAPLHELRKVNGEPTDSASVAVTLRSYVGEMRAALTRAETNAVRMEREMRETPVPPEGLRIQQTVIQMTQTYPESIRLYGQLAGTLEDAANFIQAGNEPLDAWGRQEAAALPLFEQIARVEERRAQMAANLRQ